MNFKPEFYQKYVATHIIPRKGEINLNTFKLKAADFQFTYGKFLPTDRQAYMIDLGCGAGNIVWWLQEQGYQQTMGIDLCDDYINLGVKLGVKNLIADDIQQFLQDKVNLYDLIFARDVLEHFTKDEMLTILKLCYQSLKKGGKLIIQVPNADSPFYGRIRYGDFTHEQAFTTTSLSQIFNFIGFDHFKFYGASFPQRSLKAQIRYSSWKLIETWYKMILFIETGSRGNIFTLNLIAVTVK